MSGLGMRAVGLYLRLTSRRRMATAERARARMAAPKSSAAPPARLRARHTVTERRFGQFTTYTVTPRHRAPHCAVLFLHGGSYIAEIARQHWGLIARLVDHGARVDVPIYGLAPRFSHHDAYPFVTEAYRAMAAEAPGPVTVLGDSAGGGLALGFTQTLAGLDEPVRRPDRLVLIAPWLDLTLSNPDMAAVDDPWLTRAGLLEAGRAWAAGTDPTDPRLSPLNGPMDALPPTDLYIGTRDLGYPDACAFRDRATAAGVRVEFTVCGGALHDYPLLPTREGRAAAARIARAVCASR
ncbi:MULTISPECIES: alpha/beta hydrolase fold domain-containing protein [Nocardia]|uniref:alpha/beta hydrolase fold domain-containing protein n=1 Tax=Nocardia TaxID=1817 RepID=UPI000BEF5B40|nr:MULTISPECIES: alpha/beta hydrolase fold domain-containing protein [Nocardia]MBF6184639.1 alpha/beta hydrolase fold domain-containing protein [Nocardia farcinica]MBF6247958.1 alpha/beta hydrolase fold domain-containing protein [Nocardia elegans]MBF6310483.1 alpha/beta hydrolase fold domain-containing protein [Nocardia farcinica]MBF6405698.1 alpha/beta hydrolase fold domain-containing protein [Nocardia farcinica]PEH75357.1 esterase [Nocardia sp. FDAARGOS_372]